MSYDFDTPVPLKNTHSLKHDMMEAYSGVTADDALAMWVADMDFKAAPAITEALQETVSRGVYGYYGDDGSVRRAIAGWMKDRHGWDFDPAHISFSHGVVAGLGMILDAFSKPGDEIILFTPVYHAFSRKIAAMGRKVHESYLVLREGQYEMDLETLATKMDGRQKAVIFCSPHNPGGRLWSREEIRALAEFCATHDLLLISDEIHMDLTFPGQQHLPTAVAAPEAKPRLVTITAASKGFNLAGGETGFLIAEDDALRKELAKSAAAIGGPPNRFGLTMTEAAFARSADWSEAVRAYLAENFRLFRDGLNAIPGVRVMDMPSTYLAWVDFTDTGMTSAEIADRLANDARIATNAGEAFGTGGQCHRRFNVATPRENVLEAVSRMQAAFADLQ